MTKGMIFDIEEFAVHDGPGIRKTVFFKGCPLKCNWCHNPEGMSFKKELMVSKGSCIHCGRCIDICKHEKCIACGACINVCPLHIRKICGIEYEAKDLARELLKGKEILEKSNGGITISGGEPLAQPEFLLELIKELKPIHVAIETSGYAPEEVFKKVADVVDLVLMDIKSTDPKIHKEVTGVDNTLILKNLNYLCSTSKKFYIRIPLIPGITDTKENMEKIAALLKDAKSLERVELLPYNKMAGAKYSMLGKEYKPIFDVEQKPRVYLNPFKKYSIRSVVL
ncbi:glycyl-radical enzyme activating protein [Biomaibacter acetigenes]|uniref:Glycyl-radical enzyme activating protein n=1 Tax=Biomaibacter acetigenes TaxID=2316383 RepID=A0A3G2R7B9_9FIRM|nr:glycyl-radical enzyme activating protein [Biomaibacter acetigenes]AYO31331.1 glycyl-radical enzyme activating protein [Biomaibacter acetigenes]